MIGNRHVERHHLGVTRNALRENRLVIFGLCSIGLRRHGPFISCHIFLPLCFALSGTHLGSSLPCWTFASFLFHHPFIQKCWFFCCLFEFPWIFVHIHISGGGTCIPVSASTKVGVSLSFSSPWPKRPERPKPQV